ncbi:hypothetical protein AB0N18_18400 [Streptomyces griseoincarnatus]
MLKEARAHLTAGLRHSAAGLESAGMVELTDAQAHQISTVREFADEATRWHYGSRPYAGGWLLQLSAGPGTLYRIGIHRHLGDLEAALVHVARMDAGQGHGALTGFCGHCCRRC